jgi:hypothetical protein
MIKIIVESIGGYEAARNEFTECGDIEWFTTSIGLIEELNYKGVKISSLESDLSIDMQNEIGFSAYLISSQITDFMNTYTKDWRGFVEFKMAFGSAVTSLLYTYIYKGMLIDRQLDNNTDQIVCVGDSSKNSLDGLQLGVKRFDTIFALLVKNTNNCKLSVLEYTECSDNLDRLDNWVRTRPMGKQEKILSVINNTPSSFIYKVWSIIESYGILKRVCLWPKPRYKIFFYKDCELMDEVFLKILIKGSQVAKFPKFPKFKSKKINNKKITNSFFSKKIEKICIEAIISKGLKPGAATRSACKLISQDLFEIMHNTEAVFPDLLSDFNYKKDMLKDGGVVFTNYFSSPIERLFGLYCLENKVPVVAFEHGITMGLSEWAKYSSKYSGMLLAGKGVYHWSTSLRDLKFSSMPFQKILIGGLPIITGKIILKKAQFVLSRLWLKISLRKKIIIYVADAERNNFIYGPHKENDLQYEKTTMEIVGYLAKENKDSIIILKLYPTLRYVESCKFSSLLEMHKNIRIITNIDFRFLRAAVDLICLSSSQSTLGWALGASCPVWMFEKKSAPVIMKGEVLNIQLPSINRVIKLDGVSFTHRKDDIENILKNN